MSPTNPTFSQWVYDNRRRSACLERKWYHGYIHVYKPKHHFADQRGYVKEHRLVWEYYNKATLMPWAVVHHKNGDIADNKIENLTAGMRNQHKNERF